MAYAIAAVSPPSTREPRVPHPPIWPAGALVDFPDPRDLPRDVEVVAEGAVFEPEALVAAYRLGIFPWPADESFVPWVSPRERAVLRLDRPLHWSRSLRRAMRSPRFSISVDRAFAEVMRAAGEGRDEGTWIVPDLVDGYRELHALGWAHSLEVWDEARTLVGGIYGVAVGGVFAGESMFHRVTDASKVAFATLAERLRAAGFSLLDAQVMTPHLASLGCVPLARADYLDELARVRDLALPFPGDPA